MIILNSNIQQKNWNQQNSDWVRNVRKLLFIVKWINIGRYEVVLEAKMKSIIKKNVKKLETNQSVRHFVSFRSQSAVTIQMFLIRFCSFNSQVPNARHHSWNDAFHTLAKMHRNAWRPHHFWICRKRASSSWFRRIMWVSLMHPWGVSNEEARSLSLSLFAVLFGRGGRMAMCLGLGEA